MSDTEQEAPSAKGFFGKALDWLANFHDRGFIEKGADVVQYLAPLAGNRAAFLADLAEAAGDIDWKKVKEQGLNADTLSDIAGAASDIAGNRLADRMGIKNPLLKELFSEGMQFVVDKAVENIGHRIEKNREQGQGEAQTEAQGSESALAAAAKKFHDGKAPEGAANEGVADPASIANRANELAAEYNHQEKPAGPDVDSVASPVNAPARVNAPAVAQR